MKALYKFQADIKPSMLVIVCFALQMCCCCLIESYSIQLVIAAFSIFVPGITAASLNHHHQHHNIFNLPILNRLFELILSLQTGLSSYAWVLHHNLGHHPHYHHQHAESGAETIKSRTLDESRWTFKSGRTMNFWQYTAIGFCMAYPRVHKTGLKYKSVYIKYLFWRVVYYVMITAGLYYFGMHFFLLFILPSLVVLFFTVGATYKHHTGLRAENSDHYSASYNNINNFYNYLTCNLGYHTAHHIRPGLHWSLLPAYHEKIRHKIPPALIQNSPVKLVQWVENLRLKWKIVQQSRA